MSEMLTISIIESQNGARLDKALAEGAFSEGVSRVTVQRLLKEGKIFLTMNADGALDSPEIMSEAKFKVSEGEVYQIEVPPPVDAAPKAEAFFLDIKYEDDDLLVLNKPAGLVVHPAAGNHRGTLVNGLLAHCGDSLSGIGGVIRPGIVHRLDKDTSGLMVVAKNDMAHQGLSSQFEDRSLSRLYKALVWGVPNPVKGEVEGAIGRHPRSRQKMDVVSHGGKEAKTFYDVLEPFSMLVSLIQCKLATGRTHQIRVHMGHIGYPVVGDPLYGRRRIGGIQKDFEKAEGKVEERKGLVQLLQEFPRQALHAAEITFVHPRSGERLHFSAELPDDMQALLDIVRERTS